MPSRHAAPRRTTPLTAAVAALRRRYLLERLKCLCEDIIRRFVTVDNVVSLFVLAHRHRADGLREVCLDYIVSHIDEVKRSQRLMELKEEPELLLELLMRQ